MSRPKGAMHRIPITVTNAGSGSSFSAGSDLWDHSSSTLRFHKADHGMMKHDYHLIEFVLDDRTDDGLRFPSVPHDAMWVSKVEEGQEPSCPTEENGGDYEVIEPICVCDDGQRLIVRNDNPREEQWAFTLNFVKRGANEADSREYVSWDPIIQNQNGGAHWGI